MSDSPDDKRRAFEAKMKALRDSYVEALPGKLAQIREHWATLHSLRRYPAELVMPFRNEVHKLAGSGASYGFSSLSTLMQRIEQRLDQLVDFPEDSEPLVVEISELMQQIESFDKPQDMAGSEEVSVGLKKSRPSVPRVLLVGSSAEAMKRLPEQISVLTWSAWIMHTQSRSMMSTSPKSSFVWKRRAKSARRQRNSARVRLRSYSHCTRHPI